MCQAVQKLTAAGASKKKRKNKRKKPAQKVSVGAQSDAGVTITKSDLLGTVSVPAQQARQNGSYPIRCSGITFLKTLSASFERVKFLSVRIEYKPAAAMTQAGLVSMGMDWNWTDAKKTRADIAAYQPTATSAVWKSMQFTLPANRLQTRQWYSTDAGVAGLDAGPGTIAWAVESGNSGSTQLTLGEVWIHYSVMLSGTTS